MNVIFWIPAPVIWKVYCVWDTVVRASAEIHPWFGVYWWNKSASANGNSRFIWKLQLKSVFYSQMIHESVPGPPLSNLVPKPGGWGMFWSICPQMWCSFTDATMKPEIHGRKQEFSWLQGTYWEYLPYFGTDNRLPRELEKAAATFGFYSELDAIS